MKRKATKIIELVISDESEELTIDAISLVTSPAIEQDFVFFGKDKNNLTLAKIDEEKRMLVSPALIPNKQIFRYDPNTDSNYYVFFSKSTVAQAAALYLKHNNHHKATYQHEDRVSGVLTIESWIKEGEQDKSKLYGFDLPDGTWFVKMKIENDEMWNKIKDGELKGLSIEGYFINKMEKMGKQQFSNEEILEALSELIKEKTELKTEKVELGLVDNLKKYSQGLSKYKNEGDGLLKRGNRLLSELKETQAAIYKWSDVGESIANDMSSELVKVEKAAKELGVDPNSIKELVKANKSFKEYAKLEQKYQKAAKELIK